MQANTVGSKKKKRPVVAYSLSRLREKAGVLMEQVISFIIPGISHHYPQTPFNHLLFSYLVVGAAHQREGRREERRGQRGGERQ